MPDNQSITQTPASSSAEQLEKELEGLARNYLRSAEPVREAIAELRQTRSQEEDEILENLDSVQ